MESQKLSPSRREVVQHVVLQWEGGVGLVATTPTPTTPSSTCATPTSAATPTYSCATPSCRFNALPQ